MSSVLGYSTVRGDEIGVVAEVMTLCSGLMVKCAGSSNVCRTWCFVARSTARCWSLPKNTVSYRLTLVNMHLLHSHFILLAETSQFQVILLEFRVSRGLSVWNTEWRLRFFHDHADILSSRHDCMTDLTQIYLKNSAAASPTLIIEHVRNSTNHQQVRTPTTACHSALRLYDGDDLIDSDVQTISAKFENLFYLVSVVSQCWSSLCFSWVVSHPRSHRWVFKVIYNSTIKVVW